MTSQTSYACCGSATNGYTTGGPDANAGIGGHTGCAVSGATHTNCATYDSTFAVFQKATTNALNQTTSTGYSNTGALFGYGTWPAGTTDPNTQTTATPTTRSIG